MKKILIAGFLFAPVMAFAQATTTAGTVATPTKPIAYEVSCVTAALDKRETAIISAQEAQNTAIKAALEARRVALKEAWSYNTDKNMRVQKKELQLGMHSELQQKMHTMRSGQLHSQLGVHSILK